MLVTPGKENSFAASASDSTADDVKYERGNGPVRMGVLNTHLRALGFGVVWNFATAGTLEA